MNENRIRNSTESITFRCCVLGDGDDRQSVWKINSNKKPLQCYYRPIIFSTHYSLWCSDLYTEQTSIKSSGIVGIVVGKVEVDSDWIYVVAKADIIQCNILNDKLHLPNK